MTSPDFKIKIDGNEHIWYLDIRRSDFAVSGLLNLVLKNDLEYNTNIDVKLEVSVIDGEGQVIVNAKKVEHTFMKSSKYIQL